MKNLTLSNVDVQGFAQNVESGQYLYDADGNRTDSTDALGYDTHTVYDGDNRVSGVTRDFGSAKAVTQSEAHNAFGSMTSLTDGKGQLTQFQYDVHNNETAENPASGPSLGYQYDALDHLQTKTDRLGRTWTLSYDPAGRLSSESFAAASGGMLSHTYTYGSVGKGTDQMLTATDPSGTQSFTYGHLGRLATRFQFFA